MAKQGDTIKFRSRNDGQVHEGKVREAFTSQQVRDVHGGNVMIVDSADTKRGWEIISDVDVQS